MKKTVLKFMMAGVLSLLAAVSLTSCTDGDGPWWTYPGYGWDTFNDSRLSGYWQLVQYNSDPVYAGDANYLYFNGNGYGNYYYLRGGGRYREQLRYWCQNSVSGTSSYQINLQYEYSSPVTANYWFTHDNNTLWLQCQTGNGAVQTYVYDRCGGVPW